MMISERAWRRLRDLVLFVSGLSGVAYETLTTHGKADVQLLILFAAMMGLPAVLGGNKTEELRTERDKALQLLAAQTEIARRALDAAAKAKEEREEVPAP